MHFKNVTKCAKHENTFFNSVFASLYPVEITFLSSLLKFLNCELHFSKSTSLLYYITNLNPSGSNGTTPLKNASKK